MLEESYLRSFKNMINSTTTYINHHHNMIKLKNDLNNQKLLMIQFKDEN